MACNELYALHRPCVGGGATGRLWRATNLTPSTDPVSVEARLEGYGVQRTLRPPPTLCRWRRDWKAVACNELNALHRPCVGGGATGRLWRATNFTPSTDPVSVEARLEGYGVQRT